MQKAKSHKKRYNQQIAFKTHDFARVYYIMYLLSNCFTIISTLFLLQLNIGA